MATEIKKCRVCGATYEACRSPNTKNVFRWQDVACSPDCGAVYLRKIIQSREADDVSHTVEYNEDFYGFDTEAEDEYTTEFGCDE